MKKLGFGFMRLPLNAVADNSDIDQKTTDEMTDIFISNGYTYFDTAYVYHGEKSEISIKKSVVDRYPRDSFQIADKMPTWAVKSPDDYRFIFDKQRKRAGTEYFDYYLLHNLNVENYASTLKHGGFEFMQKLKREGTVKNIGFSFHDKAALLETILREHPETEFVQLQINYIDWESAAIQSRLCYEIALKYNTPVIVMEPVKGGSLATPPAEAAALFASRGESPVSWALRFAASLPGVFMVLSGMSTPQQVIENIRIMNGLKPLNREEKDILENAVSIINSKIAIPCTSCMYCTEGCPQKIPIPTHFRIYNDRHIFGLTPGNTLHYKTLVPASSCVLCRKCEEHCPQHIEITDRLKDIVGVFE